MSKRTRCNTKRWFEIDATYFERTDELVYTAKIFIQWFPPEIADLVDCIQQAFLT